MRRVICYGFENGKLWFGYVTLWSIIASYFRNGRCLEVKPIKGYEKYAYYPDVLIAEWGSKYHHLANWWSDEDGTPFSAIALAERKTIEEIMQYKGIREKEKRG